MENRKVYLTGESYAGVCQNPFAGCPELTQGKYYVPYIADEFIKREDDVYFNLAGIAVNDPILGDSTLAQQGTESARR